MDSYTDNNGLNYTILPSKKTIIERLFKEEKISFDEMWVLLQDNEGVRYYTMPQTVQPLLPLPWNTCTTNGVQENSVTFKPTENGNNQE